MGEAAEGGEVAVMWFTVKKGVEAVEVSYAHGESTLFVENVAVRPDDPFDVSLDMGKNFKTRDKQDHTYADAQDFADEVDSLKSVHISDATVIKAIDLQLKRLKKRPERGRLRILLQGEHWFNISMEAHDEHSLMLRVLSIADL